MWFLISCSHAYAVGAGCSQLLHTCPSRSREKKNGSGVWMEIRSPKRITEVVFSILFFFPLINIFWLFFATWDLNLMAMESGWVLKNINSHHNPLKKKKRNDSHMSSAISIKPRKELTTSTRESVLACIHV